MNSMLGALVGDAAGATLEFCHKEITEEMALKAMAMPGGGSIRAGPGQITDDGELTLTLWQALHSDEPFSLMKGYNDWYESCPFDMGQTCSLAFETFYDYFKDRNIKSVDECKETIKKLNTLSEANGALMRATAIPTWAVRNSNVSISTAINLARDDALLSHPSIVCQEVNMIYVYTIIHLLLRKSPQETLILTNDFVSTQITSDKVKKWYFEESLNISILDATKQIGHVRWGFVMAIYFLRNPEIGFEDAIKITLMKGGDTDTNAAIVGGLVGSYHVIPEYMLRPVLEFDCTIDGSTNGMRHHKRPAEYSVKKVIGHLIKFS